VNRTGTGLTVLIAPDSFKGSIAAGPAARAIAAGWARVRPADTIIVLPMADGGEGTLEALATAVPAAESVPVPVTGPDGAPVAATWLLLPDGVAVVELARTSGLTLLPQARPFDAQTTGFGQAIADALARGPQRLLLAVGGSGSTDGGAGALAALGARFLDRDGAPVPPGNRGLADLHTVEVSALPPLPPGGVTVLTDVTNPLLGPAGAAAVFGPQKGATPADVDRLDANLARLAGLLPADPDAPGAGAAGGTAFGLAAWGATLAPGSAAIATAVGLPAALARADVLITGEGAYDGQSGQGKVTGYLAAEAARAGVPALLVAGRINEPVAGTFAEGVELRALARSTVKAIKTPQVYLDRAGLVLATHTTQHRR
jgi:glycerate 2-kinase